jgi:hypothetical protein
LEFIGFFFRGGLGASLHHAFISYYLFNKLIVKDSRRKVKRRGGVSSPANGPFAFTDTGATNHSGFCRAVKP